MPMRRNIKRIGIHLLAFVFFLRLSGGETGAVSLQCLFRGTYQENAGSIQGERAITTDPDLCLSPESRFAGAGGRTDSLMRGDPSLALAVLSVCDYVFSVTGDDDLEYLEMVIRHLFGGYVSSLELSRVRRIPGGFRIPCSRDAGRLDINIFPASSPLSEECPGRIWDITDRYTVKVSFSEDADSSAEEPVDIMRLSRDKVLSLLPASVVRHTVRAEKIADRLAEYRGIAHEDRDLLKRAIWAHDIGQCEKYLHPKALQSINRSIHSLPREYRAEPQKQSLFSWVEGPALHLNVSPRIAKDTAEKAVETGDIFLLWELYLRSALSYASGGPLRELKPREKKVARSMFDHGRRSLELLGANNISFSMDLELLVRCHHDHALLRDKLVKAMKNGHISPERAGILEELESILIVADSFEQGNNYERLVGMKGLGRVENLKETVEGWIKKRFSRSMEDIPGKGAILSLKELLSRGPYSGEVLFDVIREARQAAELMREDLLYIEELRQEGILYQPARDAGGHVLNKMIRDNGRVFIAHRITSGEEVEEALSKGAEAVEVDVQLTLDDVPVIFWGTLEDVPGRRIYIRQFTFEELEERYTGHLAKLQDIMEAAKGKAVIQLDIKDWAERTDPYYRDRTVEVLSGMIERMDMEKEVFVSGFNSAYGESIKIQLPSVATGISLHGNVKKGVDLERAVIDIMNKAEKSGVSVISLYAYQAYPELVKRIQGRGFMVAINAGDDISPEVYAEADLIYVETEDLDRDRPRCPDRRYIMDMSDEDILALYEPRYAELKKHVKSDWAIARSIAVEMGWEVTSEKMNMLRVICLAHDAGGILGYAYDEDVEKELLETAKENGIDPHDVPPRQLLKELRRAGVDTDIEIERFAPYADHALNTLRKLDSMNIDMPESVRKIIAEHMNIVDDDTPGWSEEEKELFSVFVTADVFECGNSYYKQAGGYYKHDGSFEAPRQTIDFMRNVKFSAAAGRTFHYMEPVLRTAERMAENRNRGFFGALEYSRSPLLSKKGPVRAGEEEAVLKRQINSRRGNTIECLKLLGPGIFGKDDPVDLPQSPVTYQELNIRSSSYAVRSVTEKVLKEAEKAPAIKEFNARKLAELRGYENYIDIDGIVASLLMLCMDAAGRDSSMILGIETDWLYGGPGGELLRSASEPLIKALGSVDRSLRRLGIDNLIVIHEPADMLALKLEKKAREKGVPLSDIVVLAAEKTISSEDFSPMVSTAYEPGAFLAGVDTAFLDAERPGGTVLPDADIAALLCMTLELACGKEINSPVIKEYNRLLRRVIFLPRARGLDYKRLRERDLNYAKLLRSV
jgi:glycerophosphoryl diester phosphodiesterase